MFKKNMSQRTIQDVINALNSFEVRTGGTGIWSPVDGVQALTSVTQKNKGSFLVAMSNTTNQTREVDFHPDSGVLVKAFVNSLTGEIRLFPAKFFGYPEKDI